MALPTLLDIAKINGSDEVIGLIDENLSYAPELEVFPFRTIRGTNYKTLIRTGLPTTGFRNANEGIDPSKSTYENRLIETHIFGGRFEVDQAVAQADEDGEDAFKAREASGFTEAALRDLGSQMWYGVSHDAKGFPGFKAFLPFGGTHVVNAGGTTATTASSAYMVKFGPKWATLIGGQGDAFKLGEWRVETIRDASDKPYPGWVADLSGWIGLQIANTHGAGRIANLTADSGKGMTDALLTSLLATFPVGIVPDAIFMSRRSRSQLQTSRQPILHSSGSVRTNQEVVAPLPTSFEGIPIIATDSILNTDAIET